MKPQDKFEKIAFDLLSASLAKRICDNVDSAVDIARETIPRDNLNEFVLALLIRQADMLHELVGTLLLRGKPTAPASPELKLLAGLLSHYGNIDIEKPYTTARQILKKLGHEVPETIIPEGAEAMTNEQIAEHLTETAEKLMGRESPNGNLPPIRESLVAQAERVHQEIMHERDTLRARLLDADTAIAGLKAQLRIAELTASQLQNRMDSTMAVRDEAVARRAAVEAILASMMAIGRAFQIENTPLVRETTEEEAYAENLSRDFAPDDLHRPDPVRDGGRK